MVEPTHLKNINQMDLFSNFRGENKTYLKPPPSETICLMFGTCVFLVCSTFKNRFKIPSPSHNGSTFLSPPVPPDFLSKLVEPCGTVSCHFRLTWEPDGMIDLLFKVLKHKNSVTCQKFQVNFAEKLEKIFEEISPILLSRKMSSHFAPKKLDEMETGHYSEDHPSL